MILGLDISTKFVGYCTLDDDGKFLSIGYIDLSKNKDLYDKFYKFGDFFYNFEDIENCDIFVEAPLARSNNQNVVNLLQRWNGMCCAALYGLSAGKKPVLIEHRTARKSLNIVPPKGTKGKDLKTFIWNYVRSTKDVPESVWKYKKTGNPQDFCFDMSDAYVVAVAGYEEKIKNKKTEG